MIEARSSPEELLTPLDDGQSPLDERLPWLIEL